ncbi:hypothetical protein J6590_039760 [Homalodisca vitripennis]|nr:hypothetical protein J6590_039760 [Homalodisca vitripennis]
MAVWTIRKIGDSCIGKEDRRPQTTAEQCFYQMRVCGMRQFPSALTPVSLGIDSVMVTSSDDSYQYLAAQEAAKGALLPRALALLDKMPFQSIPKFNFQPVAESVVLKDNRNTLSSYLEVGQHRDCQGFLERHKSLCAASSKARYLEAVLHVRSPKSKLVTMDLPNLSLLDILIENLKKVGRKSYLHRVVYVFDYHKLNIDGLEVSLQEVLQNMIAIVSEGSDEPITGLLLLYDKYGVNMIEGSEESIFRHFQELADSPVISQCVPRIKILLSVTHIAQRILNRWSIFCAQPQTLLEKLDISSVEETSRRIKMIVVKLNNLWNYLRLHSVGMSRVIMMEQLSDRMTTNLPEFARLEFVLSTPALKNLRDFVETHRTVQQPRLYQELVWPPQKEFIPFKIFKAKQDSEDKS